jgi:hypothetical protein
MDKDYDYNFGVLNYLTHFEWDSEIEKFIRYFDIPIAQHRLNREYILG